MELYRETTTDVDITSEAVIMTYTYSGTKTRVVMHRIEAGDNDNPLAGGGTYQVHTYIDGIPFMPVSSIAVPGSDNKVLFQSRQFTLEPGDVLTAALAGLAGDTGVNVTSILVDTTPATVEDLAGTGDVAVDHNYGGTDALRVITTDGSAVTAASITAFLTTDYLVGQRGVNYIQGRATTGSDGRWTRPMGLAPGDYTLLVSKPNQYQSAAVEIEVSS